MSTICHFNESPHENFLRTPLVKDRGSHLVNQLRFLLIYEVRQQQLEIKQARRARLENQTNKYRRW